MRSQLNVEKEKKCSVAMTVWVFMVGVNCSMKKYGFNTCVRLRRKESGYAAAMNCCDGYDIPKFQADAFASPETVIKGLNQWETAITSDNTRKSVRYAKAIGQACGYLHALQKD
jgi:hypothetical protein